MNCCPGAALSVPLAFPAAELERALHETAPARPSQVTEAAAAHRSTTPTRLRQMLEGDLTTILNKALQHDPPQRYQSAERLAEDLNLYLSNRPILARPQTLRYRAAKFFSRHRLTVGLAALTLLGIAIGATSTITEKRVAERRFDEVRRLAHYVLFDLYDDVSNLSGSTKVRAEMANRATDYLNTLANEAKNDRGLRLELADGYLRLGDIQGNMFRTNLGDTRAALRTYQKGLDLLDRLQNDTGAQRLRTLIELHRAQATDATPVTKRLSTNSVGPWSGSKSSPEPSDGRRRLSTGPGIQHVGCLAPATWRLGHYVGSARHGARSRGEILRCAVESQPSEPNYAYSLAELLDRRAQLYAALQPQRTIAYDQQAVEIFGHVRAPNRSYASFRFVARVHTDMLFAYGQINQLDAATEHARLAEQIYLPLVVASPEDHDVRYRLAVLRRLAGRVNAYAKRWTELADEFAKGIADYDAFLQTGESPVSRISGRTSDADGRYLWEAGRRPEAETAARRGWTNFASLPAHPTPNSLCSVMPRAICFSPRSKAPESPSGIGIGGAARSSSTDLFSYTSSVGRLRRESPLS